MLYRVHFTRDGGTVDVYRIVQALNADDAIERVILAVHDDIDIRSAEPIEQPED